MDCTDDTGRDLVELFADENLGLVEAEEMTRDYD